jgi:hypothetical protein
MTTRQEGAITALISEWTVQACKEASSGDICSVLSETAVDGIVNKLHDDRVRASVIHGASQFAEGLSSVESFVRPSHVMEIMYGDMKDDPMIRVSDEETSIVAMFIKMIVQHRIAMIYAAARQIEEGDLTTARAIIQETAEAPRLQLEALIQSLRT